ncbi:hypothetical protein BOTBODRAFT_36515 [Botryobasidium botryosum FD-172 SS1]|uniref:Rieske domain-containing protein n=1 Tax=Botryobasidium botryosum (strain FD-172 SS1) TaxID=930990 RepID=A0A067M2S7_BOTB1|nr:hypothetical protein BOTBODRAFT_36515 [Botryobasidium botryosum FD-172 SS1]
MASETKSIAVLDASELKSGQMKEVEFGEGKVLVSRIGDKVHATSAWCTHYGAPLAKGVLEASGRVTCPWHGACFNVCTGDIEDAPALSSLHSFKAEISSEGKIVVTAPLDKVTKKDMERSSLPVEISVEAAKESKGVVIVGGGSGAIHTIESLRENGYNKPITMISKEPHAPIDRTKLSKVLTTDPAKIEWRSADVLKEKYGVTLRTSTEVASVSPKDHTVTLTTGEVIKYEELVLSPGSTPRRIPIPGAKEGELEGVFTLRGIKDAQAISAAVTPGKRLVVIGSSFIGMELVVAVAKKELESIEVIGMDEVPFENILGKEVGAGIMKFHESKEIIFHMKSKTVSINPSSHDSKCVGSVTLEGPDGDTKEVPADIVILGVGVGPATSFLKDSGIPLEKDGGVKVDGFLRVEGAEGVFAIGDIAHFPQQTGELKRIEHWNVAGNHGRAVGRTIARPGEAISFAKIPVFWSAQGQQLRYCGVGAGFDDVIVQGKPEELKFVAYYVKGDKVTAVASMQKDPIVIKSSELLRLGMMPTASEIREGKSPLDVDITGVTN